MTHNIILQEAKLYAHFSITIVILL